jgi:quercetin dioxygenase-like cupin family protein
MRQASVAHWDQVPAEGDGPTLRKVIPGQGASLKRVEIQAGTSADRHSHPHEQFVLVMEGSGNLRREAGEVELRPGTVIRFAPGAWHSARFDTDTVLVEVNLQSITSAIPRGGLRTLTSLAGRRPGRRSVVVPTSPYAAGILRLAASSAWLEVDIQPIGTRLGPKRNSNLDRSNAGLAA